MSGGGGGQNPGHGHRWRLRLALNPLTWHASIMLMPPATAALQLPPWSASRAATQAGGASQGITGVDQGTVTGRRCAPPEFVATSEEEQAVSTATAGPFSP